MTGQKENNQFDGFGPSTDDYLLPIKKHVGRWISGFPLQIEQQLDFEGGEGIQW